VRELFFEQQQRQRKFLDYAKYILAVFIINILLGVFNLTLNCNKKYNKQFSNNILSIIKMSRYS